MTAVLSVTLSTLRESSIPLLKTVARISNLPFYVSGKIQLTASHSHIKKASNHLSRKNSKTDSFFTSSPFISIVTQPLLMVPLFLIIFNFRIHMFFEIFGSK